MITFQSGKRSAVEVDKTGEGQVLSNAFINDLEKKAHSEVPVVLK